MQSDAYIHMCVVARPEREEGLGLDVCLHGEVYICVWLEYRKRGGWGGGGYRVALHFGMVAREKIGGVGGGERDVTGYVPVQSEVCIPLVCGGRCMSW